MRSGETCGVRLNGRVILALALLCATSTPAWAAAVPGAGSVEGTFIAEIVVLILVGRAGRSHAAPRSAGHYGSTHRRHHLGRPCSRDLAGRAEGAISVGSRTEG